MSFEFSAFEDEIIEKLKKEDLIERFIKKEYKISPNIEVILEAFSIPSKLSYDDIGVYFFNSQNDKVYAPEIYTSLDEKGLWLSEKLPDITFDIDQGGNVRMADEAEALYCCLCVSNILKDADVFKDEVKRVAKNYSFNSMSPSNDSLSFRELIVSWQDIQSVIINIIISACKFNISNQKKDIEKFLRDGILDSEVVELRDVESKIKSINYSFSEGDLSPKIIKSLTKIQKLKLIDDRDSRISEVIKKSPCGVLYRLLNLSSEYISPVKKKKISIWIRHEVDSEINSSNNKEKLISERSQIISRLQKRVIKIEKYSVRKIHIERYIKDRKDFIFPSKL